MTDNYDFCLVTDGSGYLEHAGGWAAILTSSIFPKCRYVPSCGCCTHTETGRAEFLAILTGLHTIVELMEYEASTQRLLDLEMIRPTVHILSDREDLVKSINGEYNRNKNLDLWAQFSWYEQHFDITAEHSRRNVTPAQVQVDTIASTLRLVLIDYVQNQTDSGKL